MKWWFSPYINHFIQPDTIIPNQADPQSLNRYSYVTNNPIRFTDPTGHRCVEDGVEGSCEAVEDKLTVKWRAENTARRQKILGHNGWDWVPVVSDIRKIIRGTQTVWSASNQPGFMPEQVAFQGWQNCYVQCHSADTPGFIAGNTVGGPIPNTPLVDAFSEGMGEAASGVVNLELQAVSAGVAAKTNPVQVFARGGPQWHAGLETPNNMNIVHIGNHSTYGVHVAFGAVKPFVANLHIYVQKAFPFFRVWKPGG